MANLVTLAQLRDRARKRADMGGFYSNAQANDCVNEAIFELYDTLVGMFSNYYTKRVPFTVSQGTDTYDLPTDFYKLISLDQQFGSNQYMTIYPYNENDRNATLSQNALSIPNTTLFMRYVPVFTPLVNDADTFDAISGWDSLIVTDAAIMMLDSEESDTSALERRRERTMKRIEESAQNRDIGMPATITDVTVRANNIYANDYLQYRLYGSQIQFICTSYVGI